MNRKHFKFSASLLLLFFYQCNKPCYDLTFDQLEAPETTTIMEGERAKELQAFFNQKAKEGKWFQAIVWQEGKVILNTGFGYSKWLNRYPIEASTAFDLASITKLFTATAILKAAEMGLLSTNDLISDHLAGVPPDKTTITIQHLLNHAAGLPAFHDKKGDFEKMSKEKALDKIWKANLVHPVGNNYAYSNSGYTLLALILEKASNQTYEGFIRKNLWEPVGLQNAGFHREKLWMEDEIARGYGNECHQDNVPTNWESIEGVLLGNSGIVMSAEDLLKWSLAWWNNEIIDAESKDKMIMKYLPNTRYKGTELDGKVWQGHSMEIHESPLFKTAWYNGGSSNFGFMTMVKIYPEKNTLLILLSNNFSESNGTIRSLANIRDIENILFD